MSPFTMVVLLHSPIVSYCACCFNIYAPLTLVCSHEVGHGFGLPHTDEDPYNQNQGNCLDYTKEPAENMYPGGVNLSKLKNMYLSRRKLTGVEGKDGSFLETHMLVVDPDLIEDIDEYDEV